MEEEGFEPRVFRRNNNQGKRNKINLCDRKLCQNSFSVFKVSFNFLIPELFIYWLLLKSTFRFQWILLFTTCAFLDFLIDATSSTSSRISQSSTKLQIEIVFGLFTFANIVINSLATAIWWTILHCVKKFRITSLHVRTFPFCSIKSSEFW